MGGAIGQMLSSAVGVAISPLPLIVVILMLSTPRGKANGIAFVLGWVATLAVLGTVLVLVGGGARSGGEPARWTYWLKLVLGVLFALMAVKQWRDRPRPGREAKTPKWMASVDGIGPGQAAGVAALLSGANPKNLALTVGGAASIAGATGGGGAKAVAVVLFVLVASLCVLLPLGVYLVGGDRAAATLAGWKTWMAEHNSAIMMTVLAVLAAKYVGDAISGLTA
ncbi:GAP family protein [Catenulispora pinisilvae]|uniref:GAP family protein n=1 Tax=Catenulispora pinisilvae TaxID=2705253 RepID=UPI001890BB41|nr:GAP family protein [Catenulispora pinisilvae]